MAVEVAAGSELLEDLEGVYVWETGTDELLSCT